MRVVLFVRAVERGHSLTVTYRLCHDHCVVGVEYGASFGQGFPELRRSSSGGDGTGGLQVVRRPSDEMHRSTDVGASKMHLVWGQVTAETPEGMSSTS